MEIHNKVELLEGTGNGPIEAFSNSLPIQFEVVSYYEQSMSSSANAQAVSCVEVQIEKSCLFGIGIDNDIVVATIKAICSGLNRLCLENDQQASVTGLIYGTGSQ